jgi:hypothetical protein
MMVLLSITKLARKEHATSINMLTANNILFISYDVIVSDMFSFVVIVYFFLVLVDVFFQKPVTFCQLCIDV